MKKLMTLLLSVLMIVSLLSGCAGVKDVASETVSEAIGAIANDAEDSIENAVDSAETAIATDSDAETAAAFYNGYLDAKSVVLGKITDALSSNPDTMMTAMSLLGATMSDLYMLPALYFGLDESSVAAAMAMMGANDVTYNENGNSYTVTYKNADDLETTLSGTYEKGRSLVCVGATAGVENVYSETFQTAFGYVGQFYYIAEDGAATLYQFAIDGENGTIGITTVNARHDSLKGNETADFPKTAATWYAVNGSTVTGVDADGKPVNFEYTPSENNG